MLRFPAFTASVLLGFTLRAAEPTTLTGEWLGVRAWLENRGVTVAGRYTAEILGNVHGGLHTGATYGGLLQFALNVDTEKALGWPGATIHSSVIHPHGPSLSQRYVGDFGVVSNIDTYDSLRLYEAWIEQRFFGDRVSLRAGFLAADAEFAVVDSSALFISSDFGVPAALSANFPMSTYPFSALGVRLRIEPAPGWSVQAGAFDGNPAPGVIGDPTPGAAASNEFNHWGTHFALRGDEGAMFFAEIGWQRQGEDSKDAPAPLATSLKLGSAVHTDRFATETGDTRGDYALYAIAERELWREPGTKQDGLTAFARGVFAPENRNFLGHSAEAGLVYSGLFQSEARDALGLAVAWLGVSREARDEVTVELTYHRAITGWWSVQPDVQWVNNPGGNSDYALVIGLRSAITF